MPSYPMMVYFIFVVFVCFFIVFAFDVWEYLRRAKIRIPIGHSRKTRGNKRP